MSPAPDYLQNKPIHQSITVATQNPQQKKKKENS
jgi:hypothetical protein